MLYVRNWRPDDESNLELRLSINQTFDNLMSLKKQIIQQCQHRNHKIYLSNISLRDVRTTRKTYFL
jgi:hypothetical protein